MVADVDPGNAAFPNDVNPINNVFATAELNILSGSGKNLSKIFVID